MKVALGAARGLSFLHEAEQPIIYRDFKTANILLDEVRRGKVDLIMIVTMMFDQDRTSLIKLIAVR